MSTRRMLGAAAAVTAALLGAGLLPVVAGAAEGVDLRLNEATKWPERELVLSLPSKRVLGADQVVVLENGSKVYGEKVASQATNRKRGVMLVIDSSLTMQGEPIKQAMIAARSFAARRSESTPMGIIFFSGAPTLALEPTTDPAKIDTTLAVGPAITRGTKIYDASAAGIEALRDAGLTSGAIVVLSDGAEAIRGSAITSDALAALAKRSNVRIFSVGLDSASFDATSLQTLAQSTGGRYGEAAQPKDLPPLFAAIGERLSSEYVVSYKSTARAGAPVTVQATVDGFAGTSALDYEAPQLSTTGLEPKFQANESKGLDGVAVGGLALGFFVVVAFVLFLLLRPKQRSLVSRITDFAGIHGNDGPTIDDVRRRPERKPSDRWRRYEESVELADINISATALAITTALVTLVLTWYLAIAGGHPALALLAFTVPLGVRVFIVSRVKARQHSFEDQLPDNLQVLSSALRAGYSFSAGIASMAEDATEPSRTELRRASTDEQLGVDVADSLAVVARRMNSPEVEYVGIVARMQREAGGNTAEVLDQVIATIRSRQQIKRLVRTLTTQGRMGGAIISAVPIVLAIAMAILHPGYFDPMFETSIGVILMISGIVMLIAGWLIIRKIVDVEP